MVNHFSHVQLFAIPWTVASSRLLCPWDSPGKNTGVCGHLLLQGIFPTQESIQVSPGRQILYLLHYKGRSIPRGVGMIPGRGTWGNSSQNDTMQGLPQGDHCPEEEEGKGTLGKLNAGNIEQWEQGEFFTLSCRYFSPQRYLK